MDQNSGDLGQYHKFITPPSEGNDEQGEGGTGGYKYKELEPVSEMSLGVRLADLLRPIQAGDLPGTLDVTKSYTAQEIQRAKTERVEWFRQTLTVLGRQLGELSKSNSAYSEMLAYIDSVVEQTKTNRPDTLEYQALMFVQSFATHADMAAGWETEKQNIVWELRDGIRMALMHYELAEFGDTESMDTLSEAQRDAWERGEGGYVIRPKDVHVTELGVPADRQIAKIRECVQAIKTAIETNKDFAKAAGKYLLDQKAKTRAAQNALTLAEIAYRKVQAGDKDAGYALEDMYQDAVFSNELPLFVRTMIRREALEEAERRNPPESINDVLARLDNNLAKE